MIDEERFIYELSKKYIQNPSVIATILYMSGYRPTNLSIFLIHAGYDEYNVATSLQHQNL